LEIENNPEIAIDIITKLFSGPMRASNIVRSVLENNDVSEPTVYSVLKSLQENGLVEKKEHSCRNVIYRLTDRGKELLEKEKFKAADTILSALRNAPERREILIELLIDDLLKKLPEDWNDEEKKKALKESMSAELDALENRLVRLTTALSNKDKNKRTHKA